MGSGCPSTPAITLALNEDESLNTTVVSEIRAGPAERTVLQDCNMPYIKMQQETRQAEGKEKPAGNRVSSSPTAVCLPASQDGPFWLPGR